jgi:hypothetical protein
VPFIPAMALESPALAYKTNIINTVDQINCVVRFDETMKRNKELTQYKILSFIKVTTAVVPANSSLRKMFSDIAVSSSIKP